MAREVLGYIDCPCCGHTKGMRITADKNGAPFGYCEANCNVQMRVGGDARRVAAFVARYPWAAGKPLEDAPPTVTAPAPAPQAAKPAQAAKQAAKPAQAPAPTPAPKARASLPGPFDFLTKG